MRILKGILLAILLATANMAVADVFPLNPPPDLFISNINGTGSSMNGFVESITDGGNCSSIPCFAGLNFAADSSGFSIWGTDVLDVYLAGSLVSSASAAGGEYGQIYSITDDESAKWAVLEGQAPTSFGPYVAIDYHSFDPSAVSGAYADMAPTTIPEPSVLVLMLSGLAAAVARKRACQQH